MIRQRAAEVFPPGEFIKDEIAARDWSQADLAEILGRPVQVINEIIAAKKAITPETALGLGEAFGTGAQFWLNVENTYRLSTVSSEDTGVARRARLFEKGPIREMIRRNWVEDSKDLDTLEKSIAGFFLISARAMQEFVSRHRPKYPKLVIRDFAKKLGVHPGIVVGQLQYRKEISHSHSREMLCPVRDHIIKVAPSDGWGRHLSVHVKLDKRQ